MAGRPKKIKQHRTARLYLEPGRYKERLQKLRDKVSKLETLRALILTYEQQPNMNVDEIRKLKKRANEVRNQLAVLSTVEPIEIE